MSIRLAIQEDNYDSILELAAPGSPAKLTIRFKVNLFPRDPTGQENFPNGSHGILVRQMTDVRTGWVKDANGRAFKCRSWLEKEFNEFSIKFKRMVELAWNNQLILLPPEDSGDADGLSDRDYLQFVSSSRIPAHIVCALDIQLLPVFQPWLHHSSALMEVVRLEKRENHQFRSFHRLITNEDVEAVSSVDRWESIRLNQITAAHEVGHWLGGPGGRDDKRRLLNHIDFEYCSKLPAPVDDDCQYGHVAGKAMALMGGGNLVTEYEAQPWLRRIRRHTHALSGWKMISSVHFRRGEAQVSARQRQLTS